MSMAALLVLLGMVMAVLMAPTTADSRPGITGAPVEAMQVAQSVVRPTRTVLPPTRTVVPPARTAVPTTRAVVPTTQAVVPTTAPVQQPSTSAVPAPSVAPVPPSGPTMLVVGLWLLGGLALAIVVAFFTIARLSRDSSGK
jgi:hypothetical protein